MYFLDARFKKNLLPSNIRCKINHSVMHPSGQFMVIRFVDELQIILSRASMMN